MIYARLVRIGEALAAALMYTFLGHFKRQQGEGDFESVIMYRRPFAAGELFGVAARESLGPGLAQHIHKLKPKASMAAGSGRKRLSIPSA